MDSELVHEMWVELKDDYNVNRWGSYVVRNYLAEPHTEVEWLVGPIPGDYYGKEVVMTYSLNSDVQKSLSNLGNESEIEFFTDANGRQNIRRVKDTRFSFNFTHSDINADPITSNYYPITTGVSYYIKLYF